MAVFIGTSQQGLNDYGLRGSSGGTVLYLAVFGTLPLRPSRVGYIWLTGYGSSGVNENYVFFQGAVSSHGIIKTMTPVAFPAGTMVRTVIEWNYSGIDFQVYY